jgi:hypothetical protein
MIRNIIRSAAALALSAASLTALAHGDEPHGDEPASVAGAVAGNPHFEAATDAFEMVARLDAEGLTMFINRFETNEPVLQAKVELESGAARAVAEYRPDTGGYVVRDVAFVKELNRPGAHSVIVTLTAGSEADLLEGTLSVAAAQGAHAEERRAPPVVPAMAGALGTALLGVGALALHRRKAKKGAAQ